MSFVETSCLTYIDYAKKDSLISGLRLLYSNIRSIRQPKKLDELKCRLDIFPKIDIIVIVESWLREDEQAYFQLKNYNLVTLNRQDRVGGGIMVYVHDTWQSDIIKSLNSVGVKHQLLTLNISNQSLSASYYLTVVYNPSASNSPSFLPDFSHYLFSYAQNSKEKGIVVGDFNIILDNNSQQTIEYSSILDSLGYTLANHKFPTRISDTTSTFLDHIFLSPAMKEAHIYNISDDLLDHNLLVLNLPRSPHLTVSENYGPIHKVFINYSLVADYLKFNTFGITDQNVDTQFSKF